MKTLLAIILNTLLLASQIGQAAKQIDLSDKNQALTGTTLTTKNMQQSLKKQLKLDDDYSFSFKSSNTDLKGNTHTRYQQYYKNIRVWGQQAITHHSKKNSTTSLSGRIVKQIEKDLSDDLMPTFTSAAIIALAKQRAIEKFGGLSHFSTQQADLIIYLDTQLNKARLAYLVELKAQKNSNGPFRHMFIMDANNGLIYQSWNALMNYEVTGPGGNSKTGKYIYGTDYPALDANDNGAGQCFLENTNVRAVNLNHEWSTSSNTPFQFTCPENTFKEINGAYSPINDAFFFGNIAFDMYNDWYATAPLPFQLSMKVHYGNSYGNAFWDGQAMTFGDGHSEYFPLVDINVSVHEVSHGFTNFNSDLIYYGESGGMNEAFSDIAGEAAEYYWKGSVDWFQGGDIMKNADGLRFFEDPTQDGFSIPHYDDYYAGIDVHFSSGIYNRAYFLLANKSGWNPKTAFDIFVLANQSYWLNNETFASGACGLLSAALDLEYDWKEVYDALYTVGVICTSGNAIDEDRDSISDLLELIYGFDPNDATDATQDFDGDGLSNIAEINYGSDPKGRDGDNDGLPDFDELTQFGTEANNPDTDGDGMDDGWETLYGLNPTNSEDAVLDSDGDSISNLEEYRDNTDPSDDTSLKLSYTPSIYDFEDGELMDDAVQYPGASAGFSISDTQASSGNFSLASDDIGDNQSAAIEWNITADEGVLSFDRKTSTELGWDFFLIYIDGNLAYSVSGENDWATIEIPISEGTHTILFMYSKDYSVSSGADTVWLDNIFYTGLAHDDDGDSIDNAWETFFELNPNYPNDALLDNDNDGLNNLSEFIAETNPTIADTDGDGLSDGDELNTHNTDPNNNDSDSDGLNDGLEVSQSLNPLDSTDAALDLDEDGISNMFEHRFGSDLNDATSMPTMLGYLSNNFNDALSDHWTSPGNQTWLLEANSEQDMQLKAEPISNDKQARIDYTNVFETGVLSFDVYYDTEEDNDEVQILLDEQVIHTFSGQSESTPVDIELDRGGHTISFIYSKNSVASSIMDTVSIDNLMFIAPDADSDEDGLNNGDEIAAGTDPMNADSDGDGLLDGEEVGLGLNALSMDSDNDGLRDDIDPFPLDAKRWTQSSGGGSINPFILLLSLLLILFNSKKPRLTHSLRHKPNL